MYYPHMVQAGVGPYPGAPGFPPAPSAVNPDTLSVAVQVKADPVSQMKPDGAPPPATSVAQIYMHKKPTTPQTVQQQFSHSPIIGTTQNPAAGIVPTSVGPTTLPLSLPVANSTTTITNGIEQQTVSIPELLQQSESDISAAQQQQQSQQQQQQTVSGAGGGGGGGGGGITTTTSLNGLPPNSSIASSPVGCILSASSTGLSCSGANTVTTTATINTSLPMKIENIGASMATSGTTVTCGAAAIPTGVSVLGLPTMVSSSTVASQTTVPTAIATGLGGAVSAATGGGIVTSSVTTPAATSLALVSAAALASADQKSQPKRLHVSNIPFRFRDPDLRAMFGQFGTILDVEIIFNERGSKGFGFVTFANSSDAERARERLHGTVVEGRKIEVNNATARVQTKKTPTVPNVCLTKEGAVAAPALVCVQWPEAVALRGVAIQRGRARAALPAAAAAAAAFGRLPTPLAAAANAANALHGYTPVYYDPFLASAAAAAAAADPNNYRFQAAKPVTEVPAQPTILNRRTMATLNSSPHSLNRIQVPQNVLATGPLLKTPMSTAQQAYTAAATYTAVAARAAYGAAAAAQPTVAQYAAVAGYGREYADPYLGHGIGPVPTYGAAMYRGGYNRFAPY